MHTGTGIARSAAAMVAAYLDCMGYLLVRPRLAGCTTGGMAEAYLSSQVAFMQVPHPYIAEPCRRQYYMTPVCIAHHDGRRRVARQLGIELLKARGMSDALEAVQVAADVMAVCGVRNPALSISSPAVGCTLVHALGGSLAAWRAFLTQDLGSISQGRCATALPWLASTYRAMYATSIVGRAEVVRMANMAARTADWPSAPVLCFIARIAGRALQGRILVDYTQDAGFFRHGCLVLRAYCGKSAEPMVQGGSYAACDGRLSVGAIGLSLPFDRLCTHTPSYR
ncbi:ATP phosphoribosyltransferase regulatory subunit [Candidatus Tremblaya princeps]|uniref:ATP phosphoribosyltransferase regulatory subunit n=1 Tax=Tremblaya princeps TaxID=189385 RepID=A0A143WP08_TREPR|nr:ATP phosphoribosyltransferase regulatory subunit [Candidatus Tremblaya princeps]